jgi:hypothetical protein
LARAGSGLARGRLAHRRVYGDDEHGAAGFHHPRGGTRWTGPRAWLRLEPRTPASEYELTLELGSPDPAPLSDPTVELRVTGGPSARFVLGRAIQPYRLRVPAAATHPLVVEIRAPAWLKTDYGGARRS